MMSIYNAIKRKRYLSARKKELLEKFNSLDIEENTSYEDFHAFVNKVREICVYLTTMERKDVKDIIESIPKEEKTYIHVRLLVVLSRFYVNISNQIHKTLTLLQNEKIEDKTKLAIVDSMTAIEQLSKPVDDAIHSITQLLVI